MKETNMRIAYSSLLLAVAPMLALSACNSPTGSTTASTLPNAPAAHVAGRVAPDDTSASDLHAGGATFPAYGYNLASQPTGTATKSGKPNPQPGPGQGSLFASAGTTGTIYYCLTGSGFGRKVFEGPNVAAPNAATAACAPLGATPTGFGARHDPPDFVGSDIAMASSDYMTYKTNREPKSGTNLGEPFEFPTIGGPIVLGYRPKDFKISNFKLSTWTVCAIANGTISNWDDPAIRRDNGGYSVTGGNNRTITFFFRSDGSGTSYLFTNYLNSACTASWKAPYNAKPYQSSGRSAEWTYGVNQTWPGPGSSSQPNSRFVGESGNPGVLASVESTAFATGYIEGAYAASAGSANVAQATIQSGFNSSGQPEFVSPTNSTAVNQSFKNITSASIQHGEGSDGVSLGTSRPECVLYIPPSSFTHLSAGSYPIIGVSYLLFYGDNSAGPNASHTSDQEKLINYLMSYKASQLEMGLEYQPLSPSIRSAVLVGVNGGSGKKPCIR
jgi:ABC-type phosphate transport system substrate-binding protein